MVKDILRVRLEVVRLMDEAIGRCSLHWSQSVSEGISFVMFILITTTSELADRSRVLPKQIVYKSL